MNPLSLCVCLFCVNSAAMEITHMSLLMLLPLVGSVNLFEFLIEN